MIGLKNGNSGQRLCRAKIVFGGAAGFRELLLRSVDVALEQKLFAFREEPCDAFQLDACRSGGRVVG